MGQRARPPGKINWRNIEKRKSAQNATTVLCFSATLLFIPTTSDFLPFAEKTHDAA